MVDIAALGLRIDADPVDAATVKLNQFGKAAGAAEQAAGSLGRGAAQAGVQTDTLGKRARQASADVAALAQRTGSVDGAMRRMAESLRNGERSAGLARHQIQNLSFQLNDLATGVLSGQSAFQVFAQQGGQIAQILQQSNGGVMGGLRGVGSLLRGLVTPARLAVGGIAAVAASVAYLGSVYSAEMRRIDLALMGRGRGSGMTSGRLDAMAREIDNPASVSQNRGVATTLAATGAIDKSLLPKITQASYALSLLNDSSVEDAGKSLAEAFRDPEKGADALNERLGFLTGGLRDYIRAAMAAGDRTSAQRALFDAMIPTLKGAEERVGALERAWRWVKKAADDAADAIGRAKNGETTLEGRLAEMSAARAAAESNPLLGWSFGARATLDYTRQEESYLQEDMRRRYLIENAQAREQASNTTSMQGNDAIRSLIDDIGRLDKLTSDKSLIEKLIGDPEALRKSGRTAEEAAEALNRVDTALKGFKTSAERVVEDGQLIARSITAISVAERAQVEADRALIEARRGLKGETVALAEAENARMRVMKEAEKQAGERRLEARDRLALSGLSGYERTTAEIEQRWRRQNRLDEGSPAALAANAQSKAAELMAARQEAILKPIQDTNRGIEEQSRLLDIQDRMFGASTGAMTKAVEFEKLLATAKREHIPLDERLIAIYDAQAEAMGRNAQRAEDMQKAQAKIVEGMDAIRDSSRSAFSTLANGIINHKSGREIFGSIARDIGGRLIESGGATFTKALLGETGKPGGGLFGDTLGALFGTASSGARGATPANPVYVAFGGMGAGDFAGAATGLAQRIGGAGANDNTAAGGGLAAIERAAGGGSWHGVGNYAARGGVDTRLTDILETAALRSGLRVQAFSGLRPGDRGFHGSGLATDVNLLDAQGKALPNYQDAASFRAYEQFAQQARLVQMEKYPELSNQFRWGGYFSGGPGKYGATDLMHFDLGGSSRLGMAGGSWENGLTPAQRGLWPGAQSFGMNANMGAAANSLDQFADAAAKIPSVTDSATKGLGNVGDSLGSLGGMLGGAIGGKGGAAIGSLVGGLFGRVAKLFAFETGGVMTEHGPLPLRRYAGGGIADRPQLAMFGEGSSPEAYVPVPSGKIPVALMGPKRGPAPRAGTVVTIGGPTINIAGDASEKTVALISEAVARSNQQAQRDLQRNVGSTATKNAALYG